MDGLTTGRFAEVSGLTARALRLYDRRGLLRPADVDPATGYRRYELAQLATARTIRLLRRLGMPLDAVAEVLASATPLARVEAWWWEEERRQGERRRVAAYLRHLLAEEDPMAIPVAVKTVPDRFALTRRRTVTIAELPDFIGSTCGSLYDALRARGVQPAGPPVSIYHSPVDDDVDGDVEVGVLVPEGTEVDGFGPARLDGGEVAWVTSAGDYPGILAAYDAIVRWAHDQGRPLLGPPQELTLSLDAGPEEGGEGGLLLEVDWPVGPPG